jgi:predicted ATP-grasp superfamily ATP-dependent carboligase
MRVLVLDGNENQAVASARSLARAGHEVWVGESRPWSKAGWSRSCAKTFQYLSPQQHASGFVENLLHVARQAPGTLVLPMTEFTTLPISARRDKFEAAGVRLILPRHEDLLRAFDKQKTTELAASLGIAVPRTTEVCTEEQARDVSTSVPYPVVLKPRASEELRATGAVRRTSRPRYASNPQDFQVAYNDLRTRCSSILVQEFIEGYGTGYFALMREGELRAEFAHRRIRDVYPSGSGSTLRVSIAPEPALRNASLAILRALRWHGVAMVEFRRSDPGKPVFVEVNGRFWHSMALACYAGVDFPALLARMAEAGDIPPTNGYRIGVPCRWILGDARYLAEVWKGPPCGYPKHYPARLASLREVLTPVPGTYHDLFQWRDPLPELGDWIRFMQTIFEKAIGKGPAHD